MPCRAIVGLERAEPVEGWPAVVPRVRAGKGARGAGIRFERAFAVAVRRALPDALHGPWYRFWDANGMGLAQPDVVLPRERVVLVVECKLTDTEAARTQLRDLYFPILARIYARPVCGLVVVRHLTRKTRLEAVCTSLREAIPRARSGEVPVLHWLGNGAL